MEWYVLPLAALAGFLMTLSAVVLAYPNHRATLTGVQPSSSKKAFLLTLNICLTSLAVATQMLASRFAPVSIVVAVFTGSNLLTNMVLQVYLGITRLTKNMLIGTLGLAAAVATLHDVGPTDVPRDMDKDEVVKMLLSVPSLIFIIASVVLQVLMIFALSQKFLTANNSKLFGYAFTGGVGTILNAAIGKLLQMDISKGLMVLLAAVYLINAAVCLGNAALANGTLDDPSRFVPVSSGTNLLLVCMAGICIWGDGARIAFPLTYVMVYSWVVISIYCLSTFDLFGNGETTQDEYVGMRTDRSNSDLTLTKQHRSAVIQAEIV